MTGLLGFSRADAVALPLTVETVETVVARTRASNLVQLGVSILVVAGLVWIGGRTTGTLSALCYGAAALAMWGFLAAALATWDHFRTASPLRKQVRADIARNPDPARFWRAHRGLFPFLSR